MVSSLFSSVRSQQPIRKVLHLDAVVITLSQTIHRQDSFLIVVTDAFQRSDLTIEGLLRSHICRPLKILVYPLFFSDEVDFCIADLTDRDSVSAPQEFEVDDIFQRKVEIIVFAGKDMISQPQIDDVRLAICPQKLFPCDIESFCRIEDEGFRQSIHVFTYRIR